MFEEKRQIILDEGVEVDVKDYDGSVLFTTKAVFGKSSRQSTTEIIVEYYRSGLFMPDVDIQNGHIVTINATNTDMLVIASMEEVVHGNKISTSTRLVECNRTINVSKQGETADEYGNIIVGEIPIVENMPVYMEKLNADLIQYSPGLLENVEYMIYAPAIDLTPLDFISVNVRGRQVKLKVETTDYITFEGVVLIGVRTDTRG